jgi:opacity protein-like surface antigen
MTNTPLAAAVLAAALLMAGTAAAQQPAISLTPADSAQWDIAGHVGWLGVDTSGTGTVGDDWYDTFSGGLSIGRYLTPHIKAEIHGGMTSEGRIYRVEQLPVPGSPPAFRPQEHDFQNATISAGLFYQFFENQWFHPFAGGGIEVLRERDRVEVQTPFGPFPPGRVLPALPPPPPPQLTYSARPFVATGFKWYVAERAFVQTGVQASFSNRGTTHVVWTAGIGVDL